MRGGVGGVGGVVSHGWGRIFCGFARKIILARDLMCQPKARFRVPVRLSVPQGNGKPNSADHLWVWPRGRNYDLNLNPFPHMWHWFILFLPWVEQNQWARQGPTSLACYQQKEKTEKIFPLLVEVLNIIILIDFLPPIQERCHWIKYVGVCVSVEKFDVDDSVSLSVP